MGGCCNTKTLAVVGFVLVLQSLILQLGGVGSHFWNFIHIGTNNTDIKYYLGLWIYCTSVETQLADTFDCGDNLQIPIVSAECAGALFLFIAVLCAGTLICRSDLNVNLGLVFCLVFSCFLAGVCVIAGIVLYATRFEALTEDIFLISFSIHFSFIFCIMAAIGSFLAGFIFCCSVCSKSEKVVPNSEF
ncbi:unnamed protein product [Mytilus coruscus]|uniref:CACNG5 n=1 Tax=Mytilus coruscus TaxID=42192 RepID=A0A6J8DF00_MYTCO|nr:unnamed protein product [Mytilus coruscus]